MKEQQNLSRREFGRRGALGATALAGFSILNQAKAASAPLKIGVVGCGGRGTGAVKNAIAANENVQLIAAADAFEDRVMRQLPHHDQIFFNWDAISISITGVEIVLMSLDL